MGENMELIEFGSIAHIKKGKKPLHQSAILQVGCKPYVDIEAFETGNIKAYTDGEKCLPCKAGEILIVCDGSRSGFVGRAIDGYVGSTLAVISADGMSKDYLYYFLQGKYALLNSKKKGTGTPHLDQQILFQQKLIVPSLDEQNRIVARIEELFSELDNGVGTLRKAKQQLAVYRQAVLKEAFESCENKIVQQFGDTLVDKPRNGYSPKCVDYQTKYRNLTLSATTSGFFKEECFKYIDLDITDDSYLWVKHNDILIQRANTIEYVGTAVLYKGEDDKYVYPDLMMKCHTKEGILPQFIVYQLQSAACKNHFRKNATGTSGSMPKINQKTVMTAPVIMVPYDDQKQIVEKIEAKLSVCDSIEKNVDTALQQAEAMRQNILKQAFEGRL